MPGKSQLEIHPRPALWTLAAMLLAAVATVTAYVISEPSHEKARHPADAAHPVTSASGAHPPEPTTSSSPASLPAQRTSEPSSGFRWIAYHGYELPVSGAGPLDTQGGLASGYADTQAGALLAAANIGARTAWQFGPGVFAPTIEDQVTGPYAGQMLMIDQESYDQDASQIGSINVYARYTAYTFSSYSPADTTIDLVEGVTGASGASLYSVTTMQLVWDQGDWRVVAPPGGEWGSVSSQISSPAGYTPFTGQP